MRTARGQRGAVLAASLLLACAPADPGLDVLRASARVDPALADPSVSRTLRLELVGARHTAVDVFFTVRDQAGAAWASGSLGGLRLEADAGQRLDELLELGVPPGAYAVDLSVRRGGVEGLALPGAAGLTMLAPGSDHGMVAVVNGLSRAISHFNGDRANQELVLFVPIAGWDRTHTNEFGCELTVVDGVVTGKAYPQLDGGGGGGVPIPDAGFVLSGHDTTGEWLCLPGQGHADAQLGDPVSLLGVPWP